jgi:hypothetical protein
MDEDPLKNLHLNPRPLLECLDPQSKFQKRKKNKPFQRNDSCKTTFFCYSMNNQFPFLST